MVVHWAGEKSNVIVALARDSVGATDPKSSSVSISFFSPLDHFITLTFNIVYESIYIRLFTVRYREYLDRLALVFSAL